ncbi:MAG: DUF1684 domain-containing protein [Candidatus Omnitrophota bacterium]
MSLSRFNTRLSFSLLILFIITLTVFLHGDPPTPDPKKEWQESILKERNEKDQFFKTAPTSPMAATKRLLIKPGQLTVFVNETNRDFTLSEQDSKSALFGLKQTNGTWSWLRRSPNTTCTIDHKSMPPDSPLTGRIEFHAGPSLLINAYPSADGMVLVVYDPRRPEREQFKNLLYFPPSDEFVVQAVFKKFPTVEKATVRTSQKMEKTFYRYGSIQFKINGKELTLIAFKISLEAGEASETLFIPFSDATNGTETYEVGRFLDVPEPAEGTFTLDFNRCYNPLCNYSPAFNCPVPPRENMLDIAIHAGEKTYPHESHTDH